LRLRSLNTDFAASNESGERLLGPLWHKGEPNPDVVNELRTWGRDLHHVLVSLAAGDAALLAHLRQELSILFGGDVSATLLAGPRAQVETFARDWDALTQALEALTTATTLDRIEIDEANDHLLALEDMAATLRRGWPEIRSWCAWQ